MQNQILLGFKYKVQIYRLAGIDSKLNQLKLCCQSNAADTGEHIPHSWRQTFCPARGRWILLMMYWKLNCIDYTQVLIAQNWKLNLKWFWCTFHIIRTILNKPLNWIGTTQLTIIFWDDGVMRYIVNNY